MRDIDPHTVTCFKFVDKIFCLINLVKPLVSSKDTPKDQSAFESWQREKWSLREKEEETQKEAYVIWPVESNMTLTNILRTTTVCEDCYNKILITWQLNTLRSIPGQFNILWSFLHMDGKMAWRVRTNIVPFDGWKRTCSKRRECSCSTPFQLRREEKEST